MITSRLIKFEIKATLIVCNDTEIIGEVQTLPVLVYPANLPDLYEYGKHLEHTIVDQYEAEKTNGR